MAKWQAVSEGELGYGRWMADGRWRSAKALGRRGEGEMASRGSQDGLQVIDGEAEGVEGQRTERLSGQERVAGQLPQRAGQGRGENEDWT